MSFSSNVDCADTPTPCADAPVAAAAPLSRPRSGPVSRRSLLAACAGVLLVPLMPRIAHAASIVAVRTWPAEEYTRVTLELDQALKAEHFLLANPNRLVVDLEGADLNSQLRDIVSKIQPNDPYIGSVRVGQNVPGVVRMVFDLKQPIVPQVFTLKPIAEYRHRLVLDLYPTQTKDPLMALLGPDDDPLARVIEELSIGNPGAGPNLTAPQPARPPAAIARPTAPPAPPAAGVPRVAPSAPPAVARVDPRPSRPGESTTEAIMRSTTPPPAAPRTQGRKRQLTIMIDPGHGGEDPGAVGPSGLYEKDVVLAIARMLKSRIDSQPGMRALLTRDSDFFVPLNTRVLKARRAQADLFVSIHADAFTRRSANGSSVYALSHRGASSTSAKWLANKENAADLIGGINLGSQDKQIAKVLLDLSTTAQINDSLKLGSQVLNEISRINRLHKPQVEQAGFAVLKAPDIPSILIETAFISNPTEEQKLRTSAYQQKMASAIHSGILAYFEQNPALADTRVAAN
nr:N-acetylmuramoyl-L-alanine amidase [Pseudomonas sp.]